MFSYTTEKRMKDWLCAGAYLWRTIMGGIKLMAEKKKAWLYLKARTDEDLKAQKSLLLEYADTAGYEVTEVAADYSPSQSSLKYVRLGAAKHDFEVLLISSWNRLGRDLSETLDTMTELKNQNIAVQSVKEKNLSLDRVLSIARFAAAMQIPDETLPEELDETPFEDQEESEGLDMTQSF